MGQYHAAACLDTGEALNAHTLGEGLKLMEQSFGGNGGTTTALAMLIAPGGRWYGKRIAVIGDYAEVGDIPEGLPFADNPGALYSAKRTEEEYDNDAPCWTERVVVPLLGEAFGITYEGEGWRDRKFDHDRMAKMFANTADDPTFGPLCVLNLDKKEYIDPQAFGSGRNVAAIANRNAGPMMALFVLLAVSNGRGGGDFHADHPIVGSWGCDHIVLGEPTEDWVDISDSVKEAFETAGETRWLDGAWDLGSIPEWLAKASLSAAEGV